MICALSRTSQAARVRRQLIEVFMAWRSRALPPRSRRSLAEGQRPSAIISGGSARWATAYFEPDWQGLLKHAGLPSFHFHALRHFCASWMIENRMPLTDVASLLGHANFDMTLHVYAHPAVGGKSLPGRHGTAKLTRDETAVCRASTTERVRRGPPSDRSGAHLEIGLFRKRDGQCRGSAELVQKDRYETCSIAADSYATRQPQTGRPSASRTRGAGGVVPVIS